MTTEPLHALRGLHAPADRPVQEWPWWPFNDGSFYRTLDETGMKAVLVWSDTPAPVLDELFRRGLTVVMRTAPDHTLPVDEQARILTPRLRAFSERGGRFVQIHNEVDLWAEGAGRGWQNGTQYTARFLDLLAYLRAAFPSLRFAFPPLSRDTSGVAGLGADRFWAEALAAGGPQAGDWISLHGYWQGNGLFYWLQEFIRIKFECLRWHDKPVIWTEFANTDPAVDKFQKGRQYRELYEFLPFMPKNLIAAIAFVYSATAGFADQTWDDGAIVRGLQHH